MNGDELYFGFINAGGALKYNVNNFAITESDLAPVTEQEIKGWNTRPMGGAFQTNDNNDLLGQSVMEQAAT